MNHTLGTNHNFNLVLVNGGSLYIDDGNPAPPGVPATVRNLNDMAPTIYFNVPKGFEALVPPCARATMRRNFSAVEGAVLCGSQSQPDHVGRLSELEVATAGERIILLSLASARRRLADGALLHLGFRQGRQYRPACAGVELKLAPKKGKLEARLNGPHITPGLLAAGQLTPDAFDADGFYKIGDALKVVEADAPGKGLCSTAASPRTSRLSTGTWTSVGPLRARLIDDFRPLRARRRLCRA